MTKAIRIHQTGGADVLTWQDVDVGDPGPGEARVRHTAIGLNYIDTYHRTGLYPVPLPTTLGTEAAGVVDAVGDGITHVAPGDRVVAVGVLGAYAEARLIAAEKLIVIPDAITPQTAAAMMLKGLTAHYLLFRTYPVKAGDTILVYAAAGGVGLILCQWAHAIGARVIGCVGSEKKAALAKANGCDHPILYQSENVVERVRMLTDGHGVPCGL